MSKRIIALGECMLEMTETDMHQYRLGFAGDSFNTAYYLAQLSTNEICYGTSIGCDPYSDDLLAFIKKQGITTDFILRDETHLSGLYFIKTDKAGERRFYYYRDKAAAKYYFDTLSQSQLDTLSQFDIIYATGISLAIFNNKPALINLCKKTKAQEGQIVFDNNYRPRLWNSGETARHHIDSLHPLCDILFLTYEDEMLLYEDKSIEETISRYQAKRLPLIIMTNGGEPTVLIKDGKVKMIPPPKVSNIIDTTCGGDSFNAGFLSAYIAGMSAEEAVSYGHALASEVIQYQGALIPAEGIAKLNLC